jgi:hypothetical protein
VKGIPWSPSSDARKGARGGRLARRGENRVSIPSVRRKGQGGLLAPLGVGLVLSISPFACSSSPQLAGVGGACNLVTDCQDGLVCCNGNKGSLTCVASTSCLQPAGAGGADAGNPATGAGQDGAAGDDATPANPPGTDAARQDETEAPEAEPAPDEGTTKAPVDAGKPEDTGAAQEAAAPPQDSGGGAADP